MQLLLILLISFSVAQAGPVLLLSRQMPKELRVNDSVAQLSLLSVEPIAIKEYCQMSCVINPLCSSFRPLNYSCQQYGGSAMVPASDRSMTTACSSSPCANRADCLALTDGTFSCVCSSQFKGVTCNETRNGTWSAWSEWSVCSVTCEQGIKKRRRNCASTCQGDAEDVAACYGTQCPAMSAWSAWSNCTTANRCGRGTRNRMRACVGVCSGPTVETNVCDSVSCSATVAPIRIGTADVVSLFDDTLGSIRPICDQHWDTTAANVVCKEMGSAGVSRVSTSSTGATGQPIFLQQCTGSEETLQGCLRTTSPSAASCTAYATVSCLSESEWSLWSQWDSCSVTCEDGIQQRTRQCLGSSSCDGDSTDTRPCVKGPCPAWAEWGPCSVTCSSGIRTRKLNCRRGNCDGLVAPDGSPSEEPCDKGYCPVNGDYSQWSTWTPCATTCGHAEQTRFRTCTPPQHGGLECVGPPGEVLVCPIPPCPVDGVWTPWAPWTPCTVSCAGGNRTRTRTCVGPFYGGRACDGISENPEACNTQDCPFPATCTQHKQRGSTESGFYLIDPINQTGESTFQVYCNMSYPDALTVINHDLMNEMHIHDFQFQEPIYSSDGIFLGYDTGLENATRLAKVSQSCRQFIRWRCFNTKMSKSPGDTRITDGSVDPIAVTHFTFWQNRDGAFRGYWGGAPATSEVCGCGTPTLNCTLPMNPLTCQSSCYDPRQICNCDNSKNIWAEDSGYLDFVDDLPVSAVNPGDTADTNHEGYLSVGPLECHGSNNLVN